MFDTYNEDATEHNTQDTMEAYKPSECQEITQWALHSYGKKVAQRALMKRSIQRTGCNRYGNNMVYPLGSKYGTYTPWGAIRHHPHNGKVFTWRANSDDPRYTASSISEGGTPRGESATPLSTATIPRTLPSRRRRGSSLGFTRTAPCRDGGAGRLSAAPANSELAIAA